MHQLDNKRIQPGDAMKRNIQILTSKKIFAGAFHVVYRVPYAVLEGQMPLSKL
jgi:hypothetical protein